MVERPFITKRFVHHVEQPGKHVFTVTYDLQIPLPNPNCAPADLFGHLLTQNRLPLPFHEEVRVNFETFVRNETRKFDAELASIRIEKALNSADEKLNDSLVAGSANSGIDNGGTISNCDANRQGMPLTVAKTNGTDEGEPLFEEQFQHLMRNASVVKLTQLVTEESRMTEEMRALVRARNFEVERIKCACEQTLAQSVVDNATEFDKHSYQISMLNEKLRQVTVNYSNQIEALNERQRHEYRQLVNALNANNLSGCSEKKNEVAASPSVNSLSGADTLSVCQTPASTSASEQQPPHFSSTRLFRKSLSCDSKLAALQQEPIGKESNAFANMRRQPANTTAQCRSESFTIYIGAQLKTMHNARILTCDQLVDLLTMDTFTTNSSSTKSDTANGTRRSANFGDHRTNSNAIVCHSQRLQLLMNLYRRELACAVLIVDGSDPLWHVKERTKFAQLCEQSAELHFDSLERQLMKIEQEVRNANRERRAATVRRRRRQQQQQQQQQRDRDGDDAEERAAADPAAMAPAADTSALSPLVMASYNDSMDADELTHFVEGEDRHHPNTVGEEDNIDYGDVNSLRPGDVYVTCHSNLSAVQVVFHVVGDRQLLEQDISSRHPCIGALRNVIRLAPHSAVHHVTFPLLLVEYMSETMTIGWCLSRAELVFKCLKGFLMEVCSSGVSTAIAGGGSAVVGALSGNAGGTPHFNINFVVPSAISPALFHQLVELFSSIFHPIASLNATQQQ